jgi:hypothetical protein
MVGGLNLAPTTGVIAVNSVTWSPDGTQLATGDSEGLVHIWDANNYNIVGTFYGHTDDIVSVDWNPTVPQVASGSLDGSVRLWDVTTGSEVQQIQSSLFINTTMFSRYGGRLAFSGSFQTNDSVLQGASTILDSVGEILAGGAVQIVVPSPSLERLQAIADACNAPAAVEQSLTASLQADQLGTFITQVEALPENNIPPACAADLIAVAEALQSR